MVPVVQDQSHPLDHAHPLGFDPVRVGQGVVDRPGDAPAHPLATELADRLADSGGEPRPAHPATQSGQITVAGTVDHDLHGGLPGGRVQRPGGRGHHGRPGTLEQGP
jgi:hypothetical protein